MGFMSLCPGNRLEHFKGYLFGEVTLSAFIFASLLDRDQLIKQRIGCCRSKFFPLQVDSVLEGLIIQVSKLEVTKLSPFVKGRKIWRIHMHTWLREIAIILKYLPFFARA